MVTTIVTAVSFLIVLSILVLAHEMGHFVAGRWAKARIEEFAVGFPPRIWSRRRGETDYSINAIPLGGYVRFAGEDNPDVTGGLSSLPRYKRAIVLLAGVTMNFLLAIALFAVMYATGYPTAVPTGGIKVVSVVASAPAAEAGLQAGDVIVSIDGQKANDTTTFGDQVRSNLGQAVTLGVKHSDGSESTVNVVPRTTWPSTEGPMGVVVQLATKTETVTYPVPEAIWRGAQQTGEVVKITLEAPVMIVRGLIPAELARPTGPLGIARYVGSATEAIPTHGLYPIFELMALLSVSLAVVNILPLPGLDGGRLLFLALEWLRGGKRINPEREALIHFAGIMFFMGLVVIITYFDIVSPTPNINWGP